MSDARDAAALRRDLYDDDHFSECAELCRRRIYVTSAGPELFALQALLAWCYYQADSIDSAHEVATNAVRESIEPQTWALECLFAIAAVRGEDEEMSRLAVELGDTAVVLSGRIIRALKALAD